MPARWVTFAPGDAAEAAKPPVRRRLRVQRQGAADGRREWIWLAGTSRRSGISEATSWCECVVYKNKWRSEVHKTAAMQQAERQNAVSQAHNETWPRALSVGLPAVIWSLGLMVRIP